MATLSQFALRHDSDIDIIDIIYRIILEQADRSFLCIIETPSHHPNFDIEPDLFPSVPVVHGTEPVSKALLGRLNPKSRGQSLDI